MARDYSVGTFTDNAIKILETRYLAPGETIDGMLDRVSGGNPRFRNLMSTLRFFPNSPTLFNAGLNNGCTLSACFVLDIDDEMGPLHTDSPNSIHNTRGKAIGVAKAGGGVGYYFGNLRPKNSLIKSIHRKACGPVSVLRDYHGIRQLITQGGKRDLAQMGVLPVWHADVEEFINCKVENPKALESFNISVGWTHSYINNVQFNLLNNHDFSLPSSGVNHETSLWKQHCEAAWGVGCPGILFPDVINAYNFNKHLGLINATNPCLTADTLIAVADGRGSVAIGDLAKKGTDVPVYCQDDEGKVVIRMMRHPRLTGYRKPIVRVNLDNGKSITCTTNHKFLLRSGQYVEAKSLKEGDSLRIMTRYMPEPDAPSNASRFMRYVGIQGHLREPVYEHVAIAEWSAGREVIKGEHVHHINGNRLDNTPANLQIKIGYVHLQEHGEGLANGNSTGIDNDKLLTYGRNLCKSLGRRFSTKEWEAFARDNALPTSFSQWREKTLGTVRTFARKCADLEELQDTSYHNPKLVRTYQSALDAGLDAEIIDNSVYVHKMCEKCGCDFTVSYFQRERGLCSRRCANSQRDKTKSNATLAETNRRKHEMIRTAQVEVYLTLKSRLGRDPQKAEWVAACKLDGVSCEIARKSSPFRTWSDLQECAASTNHKVISVECAGYADVYNGTVDDYHNFYCGGWNEGKTPAGVTSIRYINSRNCGETPNRNDEPCNLGSIVASRMFVAATRSVNWNLLEETVRDATDFLDDILDRNVFPHPQITKAAMLTRKLGLGVMGWSDLLSLMHLHYDSQEAINLALKWSSFVKEVSHDQSAKLGRDKGMFPGYDADKSGMPPRRNETTTSIAPTGTIAIIGGCDAWSIEPLYDMDVERTTNEGIKMQEEYRAEKYDGFIPKVAHQLSIEAHINMQAAFQRHTDLGVSKTINLPKSATVHDVSNAYRLMYEKGCKGGTVYRDGCRTEQVLKKKETSVYSTETHVIIPPREAKAVRNKLAAERYGSTVKFKVAGKAIFLTHNQKEDGSLGEILINGNFGTTIGGLLDAWCITMSVALQSGVPLEDLVDHHQYKRFEPCGLTDNKDVPICTSVTDFIVRWLKNRYLDSSRSLNSTVEEGQAESGMYCPECSSETIFQSGCLVCTQQSCGWTRCG